MLLDLFDRLGTGGNRLHRGHFDDAHTGAVCGEKYPCRADNRRNDRHQRIDMQTHDLADLFRLIHGLCNAGREDGFVRSQSQQQAEPDAERYAESREHHALNRQDADDLLRCCTD